MTIKELADKYEDYIIERRRFYHSIPEVSEQEIATSAAIEQDLQAMGIETARSANCYGVIGMIRGEYPGKTVALRADMDALKIQEETGLPFAADNGCMHACGHDTHVAMLLGAAKILNEIKNTLHGNIKLIFQPAEEIGMGAKWMIEEGVMDDVDAIYGAHIWGTMDSPLIDVSVGERMAGSDTFTITIEGISAHGSAPNLGLDAIVVAAAVIQNLQSIVSRINNPLNPLVVTVGELHAGTRHNVIANKAVLKGTVRHFTADKFVEPLLERMVKHTCAIYGAKGRLDYQYTTEPVINQDERLNRIVRDAVVKLYGEEGIGHMPKLMGSEDFSFFMQKAPGFFAFIGSRNEAKGLTATNHQEMYTVDEDALKRGSAVMAQFAFDFLMETKD